MPSGELTVPRDDVGDALSEVFALHPEVPLHARLSPQGDEYIITWGSVDK